MPREIISSHNKKKLYKTKHVLKLLSICSESLHLNTTELKDYQYSDHPGTRHPDTTTTSRNFKTTVKSNTFRLRGYKIFLTVWVIVVKMLSRSELLALYTSKQVCNDSTSLDMQLITWSWLDVIDFLMHDNPAGHSSVSAGMCDKLNSQQREREKKKRVGEWNGKIKGFWPLKVLWFSKR